jgi:hypothetical protein
MIVHTGSVLTHVGYRTGMHRVQLSMMTAINPRYPCVDKIGSFGVEPFSVPVINDSYN